jgi:NAD(P)-dependent dehydrogenase (short-subunit alcohol dehydrogenase family)
MTSPKVWFSEHLSYRLLDERWTSYARSYFRAVTGSSTGFGFTMTKRVLENGDIAVATLRTPSNLDALRAEYPSSNKLLIIKLDVTKPEEISSAFKEVKDKLGRIDYVFNNAGYGTVGEVEGVGEADAKAMFEVNFWGAMNVAKEALEFFREVNKPQGGYLLNVSSMVGLVVKPLLGWYTASRHGKHPLHIKVPCPSPKCPHRHAYSPRGSD